MQIDKARIYSYIHSKVIKTNNELIPNFINTRNIELNKFFYDCIDLINKYSHKDDKFKKMAFHQFKKNISRNHCKQK